MAYESLDNTVCPKCLHTIYKENCLCGDVEETIHAQEMAMGRSTEKPTREYLEKVFATGEALQARQRAAVARKADVNLLMNACFGSRK